LYHQFIIIIVQKFVVRLLHQSKDRCITIGLVMTISVGKR